eukprot:SAG31_NODE_3859_length_3814_cov_2.456528_2_plen_79_part_00
MQVTTPGNREVADSVIVVVCIPTNTIWKRVVCLIHHVTVRLQFNHHNLLYHLRHFVNRQPGCSATLYRVDFPTNLETR